MKREFKQGDKLRFVGPAIHTVSDRVWFEAPRGIVGTVSNIDSGGKIYLKIEDCKEACTIHPRQVTHRIVPKKRREWWIVYAKETGLYWNTFRDHKPNVSEREFEIIHVREVRK